MIDAASTPTNRSARNLVEALQERAQRFPDHRALTFLVDGETEQVNWTYADLDRRARQVAQYLRERTVPGDRAVLVFPPSLDYIAAFYGCLYAGVIAVPTYMARLNRSSSRILTVIQDSSAAVALTNARVLEDLPENLSTAVRNPNGWFSIEETESASGDHYCMPDIGQESIAFLQYTSGSTATPRGVMVSHGNLLHNFSVISEKFGVHAGSRGMIWLPPYHDMGLIGGILHP
ncbi:AMP-binding protein, partial [bacterium]|nr:AMP-binding protein [bacterium]